MLSDIFKFHLTSVGERYPLSRLETMLFRISFMAVFLFAYGVLFAQQLNSTREYSKGKIYLSNQAIIYVKSFSISDDTVSFQFRDKPEEGSFPLSKVKMIKVKRGGHVGLGVLIGGGTMTISVVRSLLEDNRHTLLGVGMIGAAALVGAMVGLIYPKWDIVFPRYEK